MRNKVYVIVAVCVLFSFNGSTQSLVKAEMQRSISELLLELTFGTDVENSVDVVRVEYLTTDVEGRIDTASGLLLLPIGEGPYPQAIYQHGTVSSREDVPSNQMGGWELGLAIAASGFITILPDYQGLGVSRGVHPYVHAESEALAAIDQLIAVQEYLEEIELAPTNQLFVTGYSQGGHAAMATHLVLERDYADQFAVTASAPMSGPYSISGDMIDFTIGQDTEYSFVGYLAWVMLSYQRAYGNLPPTEDIFKPQYVSSIERFENEEIDLGELNEALTTLILEETDIVQPRVMFNDDIRQLILAGTDHPITAALKDNDVFDWLPQAPIRMLYCGMDEQVTFQNALTAEAAMQARGATDVQAVLIDEDGTHGSCVFPAATFMIDYFRSLIDITSPVNDFVATSFRLFPNPANEWFSIETENNIVPSDILIYNIVGTRVMKINNPDARIDVSSLEAGTYIVQMIDNGEVYNSTITITN
jgi:hypothetical protein